MIKYLENENLKDLVKGDLVIVDFFATWCGPCKMLQPVLEELKDYEIIKVDVDQHETLAKEYAIMSVPTLLIFKNGEIKKKLIGFRPKEALLEEINNL